MEIINEAKFKQMNYTGDSVYIDKALCTFLCWLVDWLVALMVNQLL